MVTPQQVKTLTNRIIKLTKDIIKVNSYDPLPIEKDLIIIGFKPVNRNSCDRRIYINEKLDLVLKIGNDNITELTMCQNRTEIETWKNILSLPDKLKGLRLKDILINPIAYDEKTYKWILVPRARVLYDDLTLKEAEKIMKRIEIKLDSENILCEDLHVGNIGLLNGKPVLIDYGIWNGHE